MLKINVILLIIYGSLFHFLCEKRGHASPQLFITYSLKLLLAKFIWRVQGYLKAKAKKARQVRERQTELINPLHHRSLLLLVVQTILSVDRPSSSMVVITFFDKPTLSVGKPNLSVPCTFLRIQ